MVIRSIHGHLGPHQHLDGGQHQREEEDRVHRHLLLPEAVGHGLRHDAVVVASGLDTEFGKLLNTIS